jgi:CRP/FNR family cyclic AMP-dependent transcriptional regulator
MFGGRAVLASLQQSKVFAGLDRERLETIERSGSTAEFRPGDLVIEEGQPNDQLFVVLRGELEVFLPKTDQRLTKVSIAPVGPGDCIGEYSFFDDKPASASVVATTQAHVFKISQAEFQMILDSDANVGQVIYRNLLRLLVKRLRAENQLLNLLASPSSAKG